MPAPYTRADAVGYVTGVAPAAWAAGGAVYAVVDRARTGGRQHRGAPVVDGIAHVGYWTAGVLATRCDPHPLVPRRARAARVELVVEPGNASIRVRGRGFRAEGTLRGRGGRRRGHVLAAAGGLS